MKCKKCSGSGKYLWISKNAEDAGVSYELPCEACGGTGVV